MTPIIRDSIGLRNPRVTAVLIESEKFHPSTVPSASARRNTSGGMPTISVDMEQALGQHSGRLHCARRGVGQTLHINVRTCAWVVHVCDKIVTIYAS